MNFIKKINTISALQIFQIIRFASLFLISIVFAKSGFKTSEIGIYETIMFLASAASFFWISGLIQAMLPLKSNQEGKDSIFYNSFLLISAFSIITFFVLYFIKSSIISQSNISFSPYFNLFLIYFLISNPSYLIEYFYLLKNKPISIVLYGIISFSIQVILVSIAIFFGNGMVTVLYSLIAISIFRLIWLIALLYKYSLFNIDYKFLKSHLYLSFPLIVSLLLSGSGQYIDGVIVSAFTDDATFAIFRYGAREIPLVVLMANALNNGMLNQFGPNDNIRESLRLLKERTKRLTYILFPFTIFALIISNYAFPLVFNKDFEGSSHIFNIFLLLIISRMLFPQTILVGMKKTNIIMIASLIEVIVHVVFSLILINIWGIYGVAIATFISYTAEKLVLIYYTSERVKIKIEEYTPMKPYIVFSLLTLIIYLIIEYPIFLN